MRPPRLPITLALVVALAGPAMARPLSTEPDGSGCGGDAFSSAEVVEHRPPRRGPLVAVPDTLCADVAPQPGAPATQIDVYPLIMPQVGTERGRIPYDTGSMRPYRP
jgi:hypothetical protein